MKIKRIRYHRKKFYLIVFLILLAIGVLVGYAALTTKLSIDGILNVSKTSWNVNFDEIEVSAGSVEASTPAHVVNNTTVSFASRLDDPSDFYEFTVDVKNTGTLDATLESITITPNLEELNIDYLTIDVTYDNDTPVEIGDSLNKNSTKK